MAVARAGASVKGLHLYEHIGTLAGALASAPYVLPVPFTNQLNGGVHSGNPLAMQEFMVCPVGASGVQHAMQIAAEVYHNLKTVITEEYGLAGTGVGDEGGFAPPIQTAKEALELLTKATGRAGHTGKVKFAIDPASSEFFRNGRYDLAFKTSNKNGDQSISADKLADMYEELAREYPIALLEDPFAEDDWHSWTSFLERSIDSKGYQFEVVGDDLLATNVDRMKLAYEKKACNSLLLKINEIGSITESIAAYVAVVLSRPRKPTSMDGLFSSAIDQAKRPIHSSPILSLD
jgi:enolase